MKVFYDNDADLKIITGKTVAVIGYGSQGHAHANNLRDSGVDVIVGLREDSGSRSKAEKAGLKVTSVHEAVASADIVMMLVPDELAADLYTESVAPNLKAGAALAFAHGFNVHFGFIEPSPEIDVIMIAPKGPGHLVRSTYTEGGRCALSDRGRAGSERHSPRNSTVLRQCHWRWACRGYPNDV